MALVVYPSAAVRSCALEAISAEFEARGLTTETFWAAESTAVQFVNYVSNSKSDILHLPDPGRLLFRLAETTAPFWLRFHRETLAARPGIQIWWMTADAVARMDQSLPELAGRFSFREELIGGESARASDTIPVNISAAGNLEGADVLFDLAVRCASPDANRTRVWIDLGVPALREYGVCNRFDLAGGALTRLTELLGPPESALNAGMEPSLAEEIASSLAVLAGVLNALERPRQALARAQEAIAIYRRLAETEPDAHLAGLAAALHNFATGLSGCNRIGESLAPAEEAVQIRRRLAQSQPAKFLPDLAAALNNLATSLGGLNRHAEALAPIEEAAGAYRELAQTNPALYLPNLAISLNNLAKGL